ncbi:MAG TPA: TetR family transcriptional regulator, partial [Myxococcaceae bacterium]|nr:TetR family transcriptional regulator [Myxococcaceae bacterium]
MRRSVVLWVASFVLAGVPANAGSTDLESTRKEAAASRARVNDVRAQQMSLRSELNQLAARIETLKAQRKGALLKGGELETALRRSQELSDQLTGAARELARAETELQTDNLALMTALSAELESLRARWDQTRDRAARSDLLARMRALRGERAQVYAMLPAGATPPVEVRGSDHPEDLLEQADALRDSEDKVRQQIKAVEARIVEVRRERELERRMSDFLGEEALFD